MDKHEIRYLIRQKLADGRLPVNSIPRVYGGPSQGEECDACEKVIGKPALLMEGIALGGAEALQLHVQCFTSGTASGVARTVSWGVSLRTGLPMPSVFDVLSALPRLAMCLECHVAATGSRSAAVLLEIDQLGMKILVELGSCGRCHLFGPVFGIPS